LLSELCRKNGNGHQKINGVNEASINLMTQKLVIDAEEELMPEIIKEAEKIVRRIEPGAILKDA